MSYTHDDYGHWLTGVSLLPHPTPSDLDKSRLTYLDVVERPIIGFDKARTLSALGVTEKPYNMSHDTGVHGYSNETELSVTRATQYPTRVLWHELGHILTRTHARHPKYREGAVYQAVAELEAEAVAYLLCQVYGYNEAKAESRGYIMHWFREGGSKRLSPDALQEVFKAVDKIIEVNA